MAFYSQPALVFCTHYSKYLLFNVLHNSFSMLFALLRMWPITLTGVVEHQSNGNANKYKALCGCKLILMKGFVQVTNAFLYSSPGPAVLKGNVTLTVQILRIVQDTIINQCKDCLDDIHVGFAYTVDTVAQKSLPLKNILGCKFMVPYI